MPLRQPQHQHRHQSSLEEVLNFSQPFFLQHQQSETAATLLNTLVKHYGLEQTTQKGYKPAALIQATFEHVASRDAFLMFFFTYIYGHLCPEAEYPDGTDLRVAIEEFAEYIVRTSFFHLELVCKTPQPTPAVVRIQTSTPTGTPQRLSILRRSCLLRDRHRCVVSRKFDRKEARKRFEQEGENCKDDDGMLLKNESNDRFQFLEVAHILPHSLTTVASGDAELSDSKKNVLRILDMFDPGVIHLIDGPKIDSPLNAVTLTLDYHRLFGEFQIYFEPTGVPYQYRIDSTERSPFLRDPLFPVTRTLTLSPSRTIDPPHSRLLGVHRAIARIIHLSGAGEYIETIIRDMEEVDVRTDGSTNLGHLMSLRFGGWLNTLAVF
ncbi:HNH endonuclease signature motif containing protein [Aspergillus tanneri]|uniref:HNH nuclease domain-containing protein n=1 Tax=Aspergillus tanneri TaxID=1220188 RepID=A0A5M9MEQ1_9EURO|nr:uncharacterized protein ATNIH1004_009741 [Aspergillus tanneri]KAA8642979.1 hypothetical protein ATNIH1004_009741 [Aspergillus tanneri]